MGCTEADVPGCAGGRDWSQVVWHSAAHVLGAALQARFGDDVLLCDGPPLKEDSNNGGFFYEMFINNNVRVDDSLHGDVAKLAKGIVKDKQRFRRLQVDKATARALFAGNRFKLGLIDSIPDDDVITVYRCGDFVDLCRGPHVPHTGLLKVWSRCRTRHHRFHSEMGGPACSAEALTPLLPVWSTVVCVSRCDCCCARDRALQ